MRIRAAIFDIYGTLLEVGPPPADAAVRWSQAWLAALGMAPRLGLAQFTDGCRQIVAAEHAAARERGIVFPEVYWPDVVDTMLPEFARLPAAARAASAVYGADFMHTVRLMPGATAALCAAQTASLRLGLASNCQPYSLRELGDALAAAGLSRKLFEPRLSFLSFEHGFSKPDPHVFRLLTARLRTLGIAPGEAVMIGDCADNDLDPARAYGWQTLAIGTDPAAALARLREMFLHP
jgi:putative hydrolase of the HAD superfamily